MLTMISSDGRQSWVLVQRNANAGVRPEINTSKHTSVTLKTVSCKECVRGNIHTHPGDLYSNIVIRQMATGRRKERKNQLTSTTQDEK